ncbi:MAG: amidohydrolase family protein, partial [Pirellulales bacterium]|nr:amidohydrolase family protein [Pirellulales bacterium]
KQAEPPWYGPVCPVVWEGSGREAAPYPDWTPMAFRFLQPCPSVTVSLEVLVQLLCRRYDSGEPVRLGIADGRIDAVTACEPEDRGSRSLPWIAPGLMDIQFNGYGGQEFSSADLTPEKFVRIVRNTNAFGVTRFCPTLTTERFEVLAHALRTIAEACESSAEVSQRVAGIHLEGPYLSTEDGARGAHPQEYCRLPDLDEFQRLQEAAGGRIRILTMAVEFDRSPAFVQRVAQSGVVVAIGHTAANSTQIRAAVDAGARMSTHLGNGSHAVLPRHDNYLWDQLAEDRLVAGLIADGHHLPPPVLKTFVRAKTPHRCILVSDIAGQAGLPPGRYPGDLCDVEILPGGRLVVAGQTEMMAGASLPIGTGVANVMHFAGVSLRQAVEMAVHHPAVLLGIEPGCLAPGHRADLVLFDLIRSSEPQQPPGFEVRATLIAGEVVFGAV